MSKGFTTLAYTTNGLIFEDYDVSIILGKSQPKELEVETDTFLIECDKIYVDGDFNKYDLITVQLGSLSNGLEPEDINCFSHFEIEVCITESEDPDLQIKDRNFKLDDLSMELQARIVKVAEEMHNDKMKSFIND